MPLTLAEKRELILLTDRRDLRRSFPNFVKYAWRVIEPSSPLEWNWHHEIICKKLEAAARGDLRRLVINIPPRCTKPVWVGHRVLERTLGRITLAEIRPGHEILTHRGRFRKVLAVHEQGTLPVLRIDTWRGRELRVAPDHPLLTARGWIQASDLTVDDTLAEVHPQEPCGTRTISLEEARLIGYLVGDGCVKYGATSFTNQDPESVSDFIQCAASIGLVSVLRKRPGKASSTSIVHLKAAESRKGISAKGSMGRVRQWRSLHDLEGRSSYDKHVPTSVMAGSAEVVINFLAAYWACDGEVRHRTDLRRKNGAALKSFRIACSTVSESLARDVQHLLTRLGVSTTLRRRTDSFKSARQGDFYTSWLVSARDQDSAAKFMSIVGPHIRHEKKRRTPNLKRNGFDSILNPDPVREIAPDGTAECRCLTIEEDESFTIEDVAVHNSNLVTVLFPAWVWTWWPESRWITSSYSGKLAMKHSIDRRAVLESDWYQERWGHVVSLADDQNRMTEFSNTRRGAMIATSTGGTVTGQGGDFIIEDDPMNPEVAESELEREAALRFHDQTLSTRFNDPKTGRWIVVAQRLHEADLTGHILERGGWSHVCLPMAFEPTHPYRCDEDPRTEDGELLWPARFPIETIDGKAGLKETLGSYGYAGQMQQRPAPAGGGMFKNIWWRFWRYSYESDVTGLEDRTVVLDPSKIEEIVQSWDLTFRETKGSDFVAGGTWGRIGAQRFLLDLVWRQMGFNDTLVAVKAASEKWPTRSSVLIEAKANGDAVIDTFKRTISGIIPVEPMGGKIARAHATSPQVEAGNVLLPLHAEWRDRYIGEHAIFPRGAHDDVVDQQSQGLTRMHKRQFDLVKYAALVAEDRKKAGVAG